VVGKQEGTTLLMASRPIHGVTTVTGGIGDSNQRRICCKAAWGYEFVIDAGSMQSKGTIPHKDLFAACRFACV